MDTIVAKGKKVVYVLIALRNKSHSPGFVRPCVLFFCRPHSREIQVPILWAFLDGFGRLPKTLVLVLLGFPVAVLVRSSWMKAWTVSLSWGARAVHLSSGFAAPFCCYRGLCLLGNDVGIVIVDFSGDCFWMVRVAGSTTFSIRCGRRFFHKINVFRYGDRIGSTFQISWNKEASAYTRELADFQRCNSRLFDSTSNSTGGSNDTSQGCTDVGIGLITLTCPDNMLLEVFSPMVKPRPLDNNRLSISIAYRLTNRS